MTSFEGGADGGASTVVLAVVLAVASLPEMHPSAVAMASKDSTSVSDSIGRSRSSSNDEFARPARNSITALSISKSVTSIEITASLSSVVYCSTDDLLRLWRRAWALLSQSTSTLSMSMGSVPLSSQYVEFHHRPS